MARMAAADRRRQLLGVAAELFAERGYRGTTTAELAKAAGVTEPILYRHFPSKRDLFVTLVDVIGRAVLDAWRERLGEVDDPSARLTVLLDSNPATDERGRGPYRVIFRAMHETHDDDGIEDAIQTHVRTLHGFLAEELERLQGTGIVRTDLTATALGWMLIDVAVGYGMLAPLGLGPGGDDAQATVTRLLKG